MDRAIEFFGFGLLSVVQSFAFWVAWPTTKDYLDVATARKIFFYVISGASSVLFVLYGTETLPLTPPPSMASFFSFFSKHGNDPLGGYFLVVSIADSAICGIAMYVLARKLGLRRVKDGGKSLQGD
jgi:hypothetical protein